MFDYIKTAERLPEPLREVFIWEKYCDYPIVAYLSVRKTDWISNKDHLMIFGDGVIEDCIEFHNVLYWAEIPKSPYE